VANFRVHARVLDLLGEEQIADLPTAISELFKNAFDAYAEVVNLDIYPEAKYAVLWDDGFGMTESDLENRWLVVGTPSKRLAERRPAPPEGRRPRPVMGEKGIGRLAISRLGDSLLLVTRRKPAEDSTAGAFAALFLNWNVAKNPNLLLEDIYVPVVNFESLDELDGGVVAAMVADFRHSVAEPPAIEKWAGAEQEALRQKILEQCDSFEPNMLHVRRSALLSKPGTAFVIGNVHPDLKLYARPDRLDQDSDEADYLIRLLGNYSDRFSARDATEADPFAVDIRIWRAGDLAPRSLFNVADTFSPGDLEHYDHHASVTFDEHGRYSGLLERFGEKIALLPDADAAGPVLKCGPFSLTFWYWQGQEKTSLPKELYTQYEQRLERFGGLMMYRSGLRVLPYGNLSYDWLRMEERRTKWVGRYFFSHRRIFGYVSISNEANPKLRDKAGREGLINNTAYRDLRDTLISFFNEISAQYFFRNSKFDEQVAANQLARSATDGARKRAEARRAKLKEDAEKAIKAANEGLDAVEDILRQAQEEIALHPSSEQIESTLTRFDTRIRRLQNAANLSSQGRTKLTGRHHQLIELLDQQTKLANALERRIAEARGALLRDANAAWPAAEARWRQRKFVEQHISQTRMAQGRAYGRVEAGLADAARDVMAWVEERKEADLAELSALQAEYLELYEQSPTRPVSSADLTELMEQVDEFSRRREADTHDLAARLKAYILAFFQREAEEFAQLQADQLAALGDEEIDRLSQEVQDSLQLAQAGLAAEIADHDLAQAYHGIKGAITALRAMLHRSAKATEQLKLLRGYFSHLELQYRQLQPLYRARRQRRQWISGTDIVRFVRSLMAHTLENNGISIEPSARFCDFKVFESTSLIMPVFINLIDNAVYWLRKCDTRTVQLDFVNRMVTVCDSGPGIPASMEQMIFERFVSTKPRGRGLGLYLVNELLKASNHEIWATREEPFRALPGACFCIRFSDSALEGDVG